MFPLFSHHAYLDPQREVLTYSALHMYMTFGIKMHAVAKKTRNNHTLVHFIRKNKIHKHLFKMTECSIIAILLLLYYYHDYNYFIVIIIIIIIIILCYLREIKYKNDHRIDINICINQVQGIRCSIHHALSISFNITLLSTNDIKNTKTLILSFV